MSRQHAGIPLLSGPPPRSAHSHSACRKCGREFNLLFNRRRECMHCGYEYCSSCTDYQALMPRRGPAHGYDVAPVCAFCIDVLNITALSRSHLRSLPLAKLRRYIDAYNISVKNPIDKNDLVDAIMATRTTHGCLPPANENYYRKHSVPSYSGSSSPSNRSPSSRGSPSTNANSNSRSSTSSFPRPDLDPNHQQRPQEAPYATYTPRTSNAQRSRTTSAPLNPGTTTRLPSEQPNISRPSSSTGRPSSPANTHTAPSSHPQATHLPPPPMSTLVTLARSSIAALSVGALKQILWEARVRVPPGVVEKEELVERVWALVEEEKRKDEEALEDPDIDLDEYETSNVEDPDLEEEAVAEMVDPEWGAHPRGMHEHGRYDHSHETAHEEMPTMDSGSTPPHLSTSPPSSNHKPRPNPKPTSAERAGLCVVCQDEEACIAIVDCGHLALCRACSDLILASSRECPLCRTRIVTEARLLRIFKT